MTGDADTDLAELKADHPEWEIFRSRDESGQPAAWYAARWRVLTQDEMDAGLVHTLDADTARQLRALLAEQLTIENGRANGSV